MDGVWTCTAGVFWGPQNSHFWGGIRDPFFEPKKILALAEN